MSEENKQTEQVEKVAQTSEAVKPTSFRGKVDSYFGIKKSGSNFRTEIVAGLTTFMAMVLPMQTVWCSLFWTA